MVLEARQFDVLYYISHEKKYTKVYQTPSAARPTGRPTPRTQGSPNQPKLESTRAGQSYRHSADARLRHRVRKDCAALRHASPTRSPPRPLPPHGPPRTGPRHAVTHPRPSTERPGGRERRTRGLL